MAAILGFNLSASTPLIRIHSPLSHFPQKLHSISLFSYPNNSSLLFSSSASSSRPTNFPQFRLLTTTSISAYKKLSESDPLTVPSEPDELSRTFPSNSGVYAVYDKAGDLQFVGISRNIASSVFAHRKSLPDFVHSVKVGLVDDPDRNSLTQAWKSWMEEHLGATGKVPPGNETGNTTWVRSPARKKPDLRLTPGRHVKLTVPLEELIDQLVKGNRVVAFIKGSRSAPLCGFSQKVVGILETQGVDYESVDILDEEYNYGLRETLKKYSNWPTFPQVFVNGELVGGCDILTSMHETGELSGLFKK